MSQEPGSAAPSGTTLADCEAAVDAILGRLGNDIVCGIPLGLGKPNRLVNALYRRAKTDPGIRLRLFTALSLDVPQGASELERRFLEPFTERHFGADYPRLDYVADLRAGALPPNIGVSEFYFQSGAWLRNHSAQCAYISTNYTFVARDMVDMGVNLLLQQVAGRGAGDERRLSLSSNPDVTLDLAAEARRRGGRVMMVALINNALPFMAGRAEVGADFFDLIVELPEPPPRLFAVPRMPVATAEYAIGAHASGLVADGGTLQIGIGALGDALVYALIQRHRANADWRRLIEGLDPGGQSHAAIERIGGSDVLDKGLYGASEMFTEGFIHLYREGLLSRRVYDDVALQELLNEGAIGEEVTPDTLTTLLGYRVLEPKLEPQHLTWLTHFGILAPGVEFDGDHLLLPDGSRVANDLNDEATLAALAGSGLGRRLARGVLLHAAFFLGSADFYRALNELDDGERGVFQMTAVSDVNQLYGGRERLDRLQRAQPRFINTAMKMTLLGAAVSDALETGQVVSGVGGQYNFVAMAHAIDDGRSILMVRSTRETGRGPESSVVWNYGHTTIPRHLRDLVVTEYGIADLRGQGDEECIRRMLNVADSRFQERLRATAVKAGKLSPAYRIPEAYRQNRPERLERAFAPLRGDGGYPAFPFGCDFEPAELRLGKALRALKQDLSSWSGRARVLAGLFGAGAPSAEDATALARMRLAAPANFKERLYRALVHAALKRHA